MDAAGSQLPDSWLHRILRGDAAPQASWERYALAFAIFGVGLLLRLTLLPPGVYVSSPFLPVVLICALLLGPACGVFALVLSLVAAFASLTPRESAALSPVVLLPFISFAVSGLLTCAVAHVMRAALDALRASRQKFHDLFANSEISIFRMDMQGRYLEFNDAFLRMSGYTAGELLTLKYPDLTPAEYTDADAKQNELIVRTGHFGPYEKEYRRKDGTRIPVRLQGSIVEAPHGERYLWTVMEDITESRRVLQTNARLLSEHRAVSESHIVGLVRVRNRSIVWTNSAFANMFGYTADELIGQPSRIFYVDDADYEAFAADGQPIIRAGGVFRTELRQIRKNGDIAWYEISCSQAGTDNDEIIVAFVDVTERRLALESLRSSRSRLSNIFAAMAEGLVVHAPDGAIVEANSAAELLLGLSREQLLGKNPADQGWHAVRDDGSEFPGADHPAMESLRTGLPVRNQTIGVQAGAGVRWLNVNAQPVLDGDRMPTGSVIATFSDVTERRQLAADLARARTDLQAILDSVPARIAVWNRDLTMRFINREAAERFGVSPEDAVGRPAEEVLGVERFRGALPMMSVALAGRATSHDRVESLPDGSRQVMHVEYVPERRDGAVVGMFALATDVTELTLSLGRIRDLAQRLETVREDERRSVALSLHEGIAQELFAARLAIRGLAASVVDRPDLAAGCNRLEQAIDKCIADTRQVANDLRPAALSQVSLARALAMHCDYFGALAGLEITVTEAPGLPEMDETAKLLLFRAAQEALTNVARHAHAAQVVITLGADAEQFVLQVRDDGVGLEPADLAKASSLGLLGIRERSAALGGSVTVTRNEQGGTTVTVALPRHDL